MTEMGGSHRRRHLSWRLLQASKLKIVEAAQRERKDTMGLKNMTSDIVEEAPEAELWNGDADVSTVGARVQPDAAALQCHSPRIAAG